MLTSAHADDAILARELAYEAGLALMALRTGGTHAEAALGDAGDEAANRLILERLRAARPEDGILSEEEKDNAARLGKERVWIIDPLDGTREYREGREDWAVHIALSIAGHAHTGAVALPARGLVLDSATVQPPAPYAGKPRMLVSRSRPPAMALAVAQALDGVLVPMGSAGAKAMAVVLGEADIYLHSGGQYEWDNCAPIAVAQAAGLHVSRADGSALVYNNANPWLPDLLICQKSWAARVLEEVARFTPQ